MSMTPYVVVLDPNEVAQNRVELDLNAGSIRVLQDGIDWGDDAITAYEADRQTGSVMVDYRKPNRIISIPLIVGAGSGGVAEFVTANKALRAKVGLMERKGGWIKRDSGNGSMYADIVTATLTFPDHWGEYGVEGDVVLKLEALPDFYGDEVALDVLNSANGILSAVLTSGGDPAVIDGDYPARCRIVVTDTSGTDQHGLVHGLRWTEPDDGQGTTFPATSVLDTFQQADGALSASWGQLGGLSAEPQVVGDEVLASTDTSQVDAGAYWTADTFGADCEAYLTLDALPASGQVVVLYARGTDMDASTNAYTLVYTGTDSFQFGTVLNGTADTLGDAWTQLASVGDSIGLRVQGGQLTAWYKAVTDGSSWTQMSTISDSQLTTGGQVGVEMYGNEYSPSITSFGGGSMPTNTNALVYEAENLTPINGATITTADGASGGSVVQFVLPSADEWAPMLLTSLADGTPLTHQGTYRVLARGYSATAASIRLKWSVGTLAVPATNDPQTFLADGAWSLLDLGVVRLDQQPVGANAWYGVIETYGAESAGANIDQLILVPLDDAAGELTYYPPADAAAPTVGSTSNLAESLTQTPDSGTLEWYVYSYPSYNITASAELSDYAGSPNDGALSGLSQRLSFTQLGLDVPSDGTIVGVAVVLNYKTVDGTYTDSWASLVTTDGEGSNIAKGTALTVSADAGTQETISYGGPASLCGYSAGDLTPDIVNSDDFGFDWQINATASGNGPDFDLADLTAQITVYYQLESGFAIPNDAVVYGNRAAELRTEGMYRTYDGAVYGPVSTVIGDLPRIPPSGAEGLPVELLVRPSVGNLDDEADSALSDFTVQVFYRPSYLFRP